MFRMWKVPRALMCLSIWLPPGGIVWEDSEALRRWNLARGSGSLGAGLEALNPHSASRVQMLPCLPAMMVHSPSGTAGRNKPYHSSVRLPAYFITGTEKQLRHHNWGWHRVWYPFILRSGASGSASGATICPLLYNLKLKRHPPTGRLRSRRSWK